MGGLVVIGGKHRELWEENTYSTTLVNAAAAFLLGKYRV